MKTLLVIEDNQDFAKIICRQLNQHNLNVAHASDSSQALLLARDLRPDYILLDMFLGSDSGLQLIHPIRQVCQHSRIVLLTGYASIATAVQAVKLGADDYLAKPADLNTILHTIFADSPEQQRASESVATLSAEQREWEHIQQVLKTHNGNISAAARHLSMHRRTLQRKLKKRDDSMC